ncbi:Yqey-like protein-domain-containing protein [Tirmania nivea]|nr:Yqey-like protein-domain-containing protein [Tirmania nivea]
MFPPRIAVLRSSRRPGSLLRCMMSTEATTPPPSPTPPLLLKLRADLKDAMRSKNHAKLDALRNLLSTINTHLKSQTPPTTDPHILTLINKQLSLSTSAIGDFRLAGREDLVTKEQLQVDILAAYAASVDSVSQAEALQAVKDAIAKVQAEGGKVVMGVVMREVSRVLEEGGKAWAKGEVAALVKQTVEARS